MKVQHNAEKLCAWIRQHGGATVKQIAASGTLNSRAASDAVQYAVRHGVLERVKQSGAPPLSVSSTNCQDVSTRC